jgi:hypothetical protein
MGRFRDFVARKLPVTKVRIGSTCPIGRSTLVTSPLRPVWSGAWGSGPPKPGIGRTEMMASKRTFAPCDGGGW